MGIGKTWEDSAVKWLVDKIKEVSALATKDVRNLFPESHRSEVQYTYPSSDYKDGYSKRTVIPLNGSTYTMSFWAKSTVAGDKIVVHLYNPSNITSSTSSQGQSSTSGDGRMEIRLSQSWERYWVTYKIPSGGSTRDVIIPRLFAGHGSGIVSIMMEQIEEGSRATDWRPAIEDERMFHFTNVSVPATSWKDGGTIGGSSRKKYADVPLRNVKQNMYVSVIFSQNDIESYNFASTCNVSNGFITLYAETAPTAAITIPTIVAQRIY